VGDRGGRVRDAQPDRSLLEQRRDGARRRGGAGSREGWIERRVSVAVSVQAYAYLLPYPCKLTPDGWVNAATGSPLAVRPTYWKLYVETLPRKWKRRNPAVDQPGS